MTSIDSLGHPLAFKASDGVSVPGELASSAALRTAVRALEGMQKEAVVYEGATGAVWRMVSDEGPYLNGTDLAPFPLCFYASGMAFSFMTEVLRHAEAQGVAIEALSVVQDNYYTMEGSAIRGDMTAGVIPSELVVKLEADAPPETLSNLVRLAEASSPAQAYMRNVHESTFALNVNGRDLSVTKTSPSPAPHHPDPKPGFDTLQPGGEADYLPDIIAKLTSAESKKGVEGGAGSSLRSEQKRTLHIHTEAHLGEDGLKVAEVRLLRPIGSSFRLVSEESAPDGSAGRAPSALAYLVAGIGFCFMTQLGRYAHILKQDLKSYSIVQDNAFQFDGSASDGTLSVEAGPVDTHVFVEFDEPDEAGQQMVKMGRQTCFLHAAMGSHSPSTLRAEVGGQPVPLQ